MYPRDWVIQILCGINIIGTIEFISLRKKYVLLQVFFDGFLMGTDGTTYNGITYSKIGW